MEETQKNILRTHTTAVTARMLYDLGQQEKFQPMKYFSIDRVFRNEALDATHLAEFHQIEGSVADYNLTLGDLMGMLHQFFSKMGRIIRNYCTLTTLQKYYNLYYKNIQSMVKQLVWLWSGGRKHASYHGNKKCWTG